MRTIMSNVLEAQSENEPAIIEVEHLSKSFDKLVAVNDVSFEVRRGEIFGFLGPNGAGKSTTIKILCTLMKPSAGNIRLAGHNILTEPDVVRHNIGIIFQDPTLDSGLTAQENLNFHCMMYHVPPTERAERITYVLALMDLTDHKDRVVKTFSGGMKRRLEIARGLLHRPQVLFLDEPTVGLDPQTRNYIWEYVRSLRDRHHTTIFMTTHYMDEAENCDRIAIIDQGSIVALDTPKNLKAMVGQDQIELHTSHNQQTLDVLKTHYNIEASEHNGQILFQSAEAERFLPRLLTDLPGLAPGLTIETMNVRRPSLEDVFLKLTGRTIRHEEGGKDERRSNLRRRGRL